MSDAARPSGAESPIAIVSTWQDIGLNFGVAAANPPAWNGVKGFELAQERSSAFHPATFEGSWARVAEAPDFLDAQSTWRRVGRYGDLRRPSRAPAWFLVLARPRPGREEEYNTWYEAHHVVDMLSVPGIASCVRYHALRGTAFVFLSIYEMDTEDLAGTVRMEMDRMASPDVTWSGATDSDATRVVIGRPARAATAVEADHSRRGPDSEAQCLKGPSYCDRVP